jgi:MFS family permease
MAYALLQSLVVPALGTLQAELGTTSTGAAWIFTSYLLSASVLTPILGRLADVYGKGTVLTWSLVVLAIGSVISGAASALPVMLLGRTVQGAGGAVFPLAFAIVRDEFDEDRRSSTIAFVSAVMTVGGALGMVAGGPIASLLSYRWLFWFPALAAAGAAVAAWRLVPDRLSTRRPPLRDIGWPGAVLLAWWLGLFLLGVTMIPRGGLVSWTALGPILLSAMLAAAWAAVELRARHPLVDLRTLWWPAVRATNAATFALGFGMFGSWMLLPLLLQAPPQDGGYGLEPAHVGLYMLPSALGSALVAPVFGRLSAVHGPRWALTGGALIAAAASAWIGALRPPPGVVLAAILLNGIGIGLAFAAVATLVVSSVPADQTGVSAGINTIMRTIGGALGTTTAGALLAATAATRQSFTTCLIVFAVALALAAVLSRGVPRHVRAKPRASLLAPDPSPALATLAVETPRTAVRQRHPHG